MKLNNRMNRLLKYLSEDTYISNDKLCKLMDVSEKTIRRLTLELNEILSENGAEIERKYGKGIRLIVNDRKVYEEFFKENCQSEIWDSSKTRTDYMTFLLLFKNKPMKIDELSQQLFASRKTISTDLKTVENLIDQFHLTLERKPYYGIRILGEEFDLRRCMQEAYLTINTTQRKKVDELFIDKELIRKSLSEAFLNYGYHVYESEIRTIILQFQIAVYRIEQEHFISMDELDQDSGLTETDIKAAQASIRNLHERGINCQFPIPEVKYIAVLLSGKRRNRISEVDNLVIDMEINHLVNKMMETIFYTFQIDLRDDFELQTSLRQHMLALRIRLQYHIQIKNPVLREVKETYSFPYAMAAQSSIVLAEHFHTIVSEDEIGYLAMCFALSLERRNSSKKNIILVCESGVGSAKLFQYRFEEAFGAYLNRVEVCDVHSLMEKNLDQIDYIFSTVPIKFKVSAPIYQVQYFFDNKSAKKVKRLLKENNEKSVIRYFDEDLFFSDIEGETKEEVIHTLCQLIHEKKSVPKNFEEYVLKRESIMQTDFGGYVALPHPYQPITEETFVCIGILKKPIQWHTHMVQVIFLLSISVKKEDLENFYNVAPAFMMDEEFVQKLIQEKSFDVLEDTINKVEKDEEWRN